MRYCRKKITWSEFEAEPYREWHTSVMDDMEYRNMFSLFTKIKENGVKEFGEFCNVIPPASSSHLKKKTKTNNQIGKIIWLLAAVSESLII